MLRSYKLKPPLQSLLKWCPFNKRVVKPQPSPSSTLKFIEVYWGTEGSPAWSGLLGRSPVRTWCCKQAPRGPLDSPAQWHIDVWAPVFSPSLPQHREAGVLISATWSVSRMDKNSLGDWAGSRTRRNLWWKLNWLWKTPRMFLTTVNETKSFQGQTS